MRISRAPALLPIALAMALVRLGAQTPEDANPEAAKLEGDRLAKALEFEEAVAAYSRAIQIDPEFAAAYKARGIARRRLHQPENALQDFDQAIHLDPEDAESYFQRAGLYVTLHKLEAAMEDFDKAIAKKPDYALAYAARSGAKSQVGDKAGSVADLAKAQSLGYSIPRLRVSGNVQQAKLIDHPRPVYPREAKAAGITGVVRLAAIIGQDGTIQNLTLISGHPVLAKPAMEAVGKWVYQPTLLDGRPVDIVTEIDVTFSLSPR